MRKDDGFENDLNQQKKLFIGGLHWKTEDSDLREYFSKKGTVTDAMVHINFFIFIFMVFIYLGHQGAKFKPITWFWFCSF